MCVCVCVYQVDLARFKQWLQHIQWAALSPTGPTAKLYVTVPACGTGDPMRLLTTQLQLLESLRLQSGTRVELRLSKWQLTQPVIAALQGLPHWPHCTFTSAGGHCSPVSTHSYCHTVYLAATHNGC